MLLNIKFRALLITFMLIFSSLTILVITPESIKADDEFELDEIFLLMAGLHPFITSGWYEYYGNESLNIDGDLVFNLYFSSTLSTQTSWKDDLQITMYSIDPELGIPIKIENANTTVTLEHEFLGELVQKCTVTLNNFNYTLNDGDSLLFAIELIQSGKPIGNIIERRYEDKLKSRALRVAEFLNNSDNENLVAVGDIIMQILGTADEFGISAEEFASLANSFSSSSFVYNSIEYPSSVTITNSSKNNFTLYFQRGSIDEEFDTGAFVTMEEKIPNGSVVTWPTRFISLDPDVPGINSEEWLLWFYAWLSYITISAPPQEEEEINFITYYLTGEKTFILDEPTENTLSKITLSREHEEWKGISFDRNKIITNASAELYVYYPKVAFFRNIKVEASLFDEDLNETIATDQKNLGRANILEFLIRGPNSPLIFTFDEAIGKEIWNEHNINLRVSSRGEPIIYPLRKTRLFCGSKEYPSSVIFELEETKNIRIDNDLENQIVIPGGSAKFTIDISSKYEENLNIEVISEDPDDLEDWSIEYSDTVHIAENGTVSIDVYVNSTNNDTSAYKGDKIDLLFNVTGKTGFDSKDVKVEVSDFAVEYYIDVTMPPDKEIKHGTSDTYTFKIKNKNTGFWYDSYEFEAFSEHDWNVELGYDAEKIDDVENGEEVEVFLKVYIPEDTEICYDILELNIISKESQNHDKEKIWTVRVITTVIAPNILEHIYNFFESASQDIGLDEFLGDYGAAFLIMLVLFIILLFLAPIIFFLRKKYVEIICLDRIKEINPDGKAEYEITLQNPTNNKHTYEIIAEEVNSSSKRWDISVDTDKIDIEPKQTKLIELSVKPTDYIKEDDRVEAKIVVKPVGKKKIEGLSTITMIKEAKPDFKILGILHWPKFFRKGDRVTTSFRINNIGAVSAENVSIYLYVNGEEKNKVENITIPRKGYAEVEIPWIAVKGNNEINIIVK
jgi:hypothetical protein